MLLLITSAAQAQDRYTISGTISDTANGETMIGALVAIMELPGKGAVSNEYGFYSITLDAGQYTLLYQYTGYTAKKVNINLKANQKIDIELVSYTTMLNTV